jgi:hypothetical protein
MPFEKDAHRLDDAVDDFKQVFKGNPNLYRYGMFDLRESCRDAVDALLDRELDPARRFNKLTYDFIIAYESWQRDKADPARIRKVFRVLEADKSLAANLPTAYSVFRPDPDGGDSWASREYLGIWSSDTIPAAYSGSGVASPTATKIASADRLERGKGKCYATTRKMAARYLFAKGTPKPPWGQQELVANARLSQSGEFILYDETQLDKFRSYLIEGLSRGVVYTLGVLSGTSHDKSKFPDPEHWLLLYSHGPGTNAFGFWDSDGQFSSLDPGGTANIGWGRGFGVLFFQGGRFSTAYDPADFTRIDAGNHIDNPTRHRYQVYLYEASDGRRFVYKTQSDVQEEYAEPDSGHKKVSRSFPKVSTQQGGSNPNTDAGPDGSGD